MVPSDKISCIVCLHCYQYIYVSYYVDKLNECHQYIYVYYYVDKLNECHQKLFQLNADFIILFNLK